MNVYHLLLVCDKQSVVELLFLDLHVGIPGNRFDSFPEGK